ncbi:AAA family ATPase [Sphingomonas koreensis]
MTVARDFDDDAREFGPDAVKAALDQAQWPWPPSAPDDEAQGGSATMSATPFVWRDERTIEPRRWLYGKHFLRKFLSVDVAAGGIGKSSVKVVEALAMTSGRTLLRKDVPEGPLRVWLYNLEDPMEETERRLHAALNHYGLCPTDVGDRLFVDSGRDQPVMLAEETPNGARIIRPVSDALIETLKARQIDVLILDPFVSSHAVSENDNRSIDMVAKEFGRIADVCNCSINLVHHVRKGNGMEATADSARGASSLIGAARSVVVYNRMTKEEGEAAGIKPEQVSFYFRTQNDKANLSPPEAAEWHRMNNYELANGDHVGVACPWEWPDAFAGVTTAKLMEVQRRVAGGLWREDVRSGDKWVGNIIAQVLAMDPDDDRKRVQNILKQWVKNDVLRVVEHDDEKRRSRKFVEVGTWATD